MAINVDTVYQRVLALANKEQRGYITPQEFNLFANQAQMEIFEQYFYDMNQFERMGSVDGETEYSNMVDLVDDKISAFKQTATLSGGTLPVDLYKLGDVISTTQVIQEVSESERFKFELAGLDIVTANSPVYVRSGNNITVYGDAASKITYIRKPNYNSPVQWAYVVINEKAMYNAGPSIDFELHDSEQSELVYKILALSGVTLNKPTISQFSMGQQASTTQQEKQ